MKIDFSGKWGLNIEPYGISFEAIVDEKVIGCVVGDHVLQDVDPSRRFDDISTQFLAKQTHLQSIAENLILKGRVKDGRLLITSSDIV